VFRSVRRPGCPLTERAVNFIVKEAAERAGVNPAASIHCLRHAHASHAIDNGAPITLVSATLGHADLKTTNLCACPARREQRSIFEDEVLGLSPTRARDLREDHG
jgi:integrase/recombinase XerD